MYTVCGVLNPSSLSTERLIIFKNLKKVSHKFVSRYIGLITFFVLISSGSTFAQKKLPFLTPGAQYLWPTKASHYMSSSFGETRPDHFHAALDIKTWGRRGYPVYATRSGILWRLRTGPTGYGNAVYLRHKDGSYSVYAHLEDFIPKIRHLVDSLRMINYKFDFDKYVSKYDIHFKQGDVIGYTGSSGIGPPHLHFELRTPEEHPFNPLLTNLKVQDHIAPIFRALSVEPLHANSLVRGKKEIYTRRVKRTGKRSYSFGTIHVNGAVGIGTAVYDKSDRVHNVYAAYQLILKKGDSVYFHSRVDSFSYNNTDQLNLDRVYPLLRKDHEGYQRLYIHDGNTLPFYVKTKNRGIINLPSGTYHFTILASDYFNNTSRATFTLVAGKPEHKATIAQDKPVINPVSLVENDSPIPPANLNHWFWSDNWFSPSSQIHHLKLIPDGEHHESEITYNLNGDPVGIPIRNDKKIILKLNNNDESILYRIYPGEKRVLRTPDQLATASFSATSVYDTLSVIFNHRIHNHKPALYLLPDDEPMHHNVTISYLLGDNLKSLHHLAFYTYNRHNHKYQYLNSKRKGDELQGEVGEFGFYYILQDTTKPGISHPHIYKRFDGKWVASVDLSDNLSGIDFNRVRFYINGVRGIAEYNPESHKLIYYRPHFSPKKMNNLKIVAHDMVNNQATATFDVKH